MSARMTTPPPPASMPAVPDTPRFGAFHDNYEPYPQTRAATRRLQNAQNSQKSAKTPTPATPSRASHITLASGVKVKRPVFTGTAFSGADYTPPTTIAKKRTIHFEDEYNGLTFRSSKEQSSSRTAAEMFATPSRSPQKKKIETIEGIGHVSRTLFVDRHAKASDAMPSPRKRNKYSDILGVTKDEPITIYTDSKEMIPEIDNSTDNPFYGPGRRTTAGDNLRSRKRSHEEADEQEKKNGAMYMFRNKKCSHEEADEQKKKNGAMYMFRGKKFFQEFASSDEEGDDVDDEVADELAASVPKRLRGPVTRSTLKPRRLFVEEVDEEAETDIEEDNKVSASPVKQKQTPAKARAEKGLKTPRTNKILPISPPSTMQTSTRFKDEVAAVSKGRASFSSTGSHSKEFQSWQSTVTPHGEKRSRDISPTPDAGRHSKRLRSHAS